MKALTRLRGSSPSSEQPVGPAWFAWLSLALPLLIAGAVYFMTAAAGLTWRHGGDDGGDLATAVALGGVPHPSGYPLYLLSGQLFGFLAADPARALTLTTALWGTLAAGVLSLAVYRFNRHLFGPATNLAVKPLVLEIASLAGGLLAGLGMAFAPLAWSQALIIEIYSLNLLLLAGLLLALEWWWEKPARSGRLYLLALVAGLAVGHHRTAVFSLLAAAVFMYLVWRTKENRKLFNWKQLVRAVLIAGLAAGLPSLDLLIRGGQQPASNWSNLSWSDPANFWQYLTGGEYRDLLFGAPLTQELGRVSASAGLLFQQFGLGGLVLGWLGLAITWLALPQYRPLAWLISLGLVGHLGFASVYAADNGQVYLLPFFALWALAAGFGLAWLILNGIVRWPQYWRWLGGLALVVALALPAISLVTNYSRLDLSQDRSAEAWAKGQLAVAPANALLVSNQDAATFAMWYVQYAEHYRPEIPMVESRLLDTGWYRANLTQLYPDLILPLVGDSAGLGAANPARKLVLLNAPAQNSLP